MTITEQLLNKWNKLDNNKQEKVLAFINSLTDEKTEEKPVENSYQPKTELGKKLWKLRLKSLNNHPLLNSWEEIEAELANRRGKN